MRILSSEVYGDWKDITPCGCSVNQIEVVGVEFLMVPFAPMFLRILWEVFRCCMFIVTLGLSDVIFGGIKDNTHDCISCTAECRNCKTQQTFLAEFNSSGKHIRCGRYRNVVRSSGEVPIRCTVSDMYNVFDDTPNPPYNLFIFNCSHWSSSFFSRLIKYY